MTASDGIPLRRAALMNFFPVVDQVVGGKTVDVAVSGSNVLEDGMGTEPIRVFDTDLSPRLELALSTTIILLGTLLLVVAACDAGCVDARHASSFACHSAAIRVRRACQASVDARSAKGRSARRSGR